MPTKRSRLSRLPKDITAEAVEAFAAGDELVLDRELSIRPWEISPLEVDAPEPPDWESQACRDSWARAWKLREQLLALTEKK